MDRAHQIVCSFMCVTCTILSAVCTVVVVLSWSETPWRGLIVVTIGAAVAAWNARLWSPYNGE